jgi:micrococcal nuclease
VTAVVDGDTIKVRNDAGGTFTVRLIGIDTPETKHPSKPVQCFGVEASAKTAELLPPGTRVELEMDVQALDRYGRNLAYVWREGAMLMVNQQLVAEGYALTLTIPLNVKYAKQFAEAGRVARENGLGLWSACADQLQEPTDDAPMLDGTVPAADSPGSGSSAQPKPEAKPAGNCYPSYTEFCIPPPPPDLNCTSPLIAGRKNFTVLAPDPHRFDADHDGVGCESRR